MQLLQITPNRSQRVVELARVPGETRYGTLASPTTNTEEGTLASPTTNTYDGILVSSISEETLCNDFTAVARFFSSLPGPIGTHPAGSWLTRR